MTGHLDTALLALLRTALPSLFGGPAPAVAVAVQGGGFVLDASSLDPEAGQPRSDEASDTLPFDPAVPAGPYRLSQPPDLSVRRLRLLTADGDRLPLHDSEVQFDPLDAQRFTLALRPARALAGVTGVLVLYGVTAAYVTLGCAQELSVNLEAANPAVLDQAQALALAVLALHRAALVRDGAATERVDAYGALLTVQALHLLGGDAPTPTTRRLALRAEFVVKGVRALAAGEGAPIAHIRGPGSTSTKPLDITVQAAT